MGLSRYYASRFVRSVLPRSLQKRLDRARAANRARREAAAKRRTVARYGWFDADQLYQELMRAGVRQGGVLMVHGAFGRCHNFRGSAEEMLIVLERAVGAEGTLVMPTHTDGRGDNGRVFDVRRSPSRTGILSELLRRRPGARRSLHPLYSVCAKGPLAERLVADHHREPPKAFGLYSPYAKLAELDAQVLGIGLPPGHTTLLHVVEDVRPEKFPRLYSGQTAEFVAVDEAGRRFALSARRFVPRMLAKRDVMRVVRHLSEEAMRSITLCGVVAFVASAGRLLDEHFALTDQGITMYG